MITRKQYMAAKKMLAETFGVGLIDDTGVPEKTDVASLAQKLDALHEQMYEATNSLTGVTRLPVVTIQRWRSTIREVVVALRKNQD